MGVRGGVCVLWYGFVPVAGGAWKACFWEMPCGLAVF